MAAKIGWTTGPIVSSSDLREVVIAALNNTSVTRRAEIRLYDLAFTPKRKVFDESFSLRPWETITVTIDVGTLETWEAQASAFSKSVRFYITGKGFDGVNRPGNTVLNSEFVRFGN